MNCLKYMGGVRLILPELYWIFYFLSAMIRPPLLPYIVGSFNNPSLHFFKIKIKTGIVSTVTEMLFYI